MARIEIGRDNALGIEESLWPIEISWMSELVVLSGEENVDKLELLDMWNHEVH